MNTKALAASHFLAISHAILQSGADLVLISAGAGYGKSTLLQDLLKTADLMSMPAALIESASISDGQTLECLLSSETSRLCGEGARMAQKYRPILTINAAGVRLSDGQFKLILRLAYECKKHLKIVLSTSGQALNYNNIFGKIEVYRLGPNELSIPENQLAKLIIESGAKASESELAILIRESGGWPGIVFDFIAANVSTDVSVAEYISSARSHDYIRRSALSDIPPEYHSLLGILSSFKFIPSSISERGPYANRASRILRILTALGYANQHRIENEIYYTIAPCIRHFSLMELKEGFPGVSSALKRDVINQLLAMGLFEQAIDTAISLGEFDAALSCMSENCDSALSDGKLINLCRWSESIPAKALVQDDNLISTLIISYAYLKDFSGLVNFTARTNKEGSRVIGCREREALDISILIRLIDVGQLEFAISWAERLLCDNSQDIPKHFSGLLSGLLGGARLASGNIVSAVAALRTAVDVSQRSGHKFGTVSALSVLGYTYAVNGRFQDSKNAFEAISEISDGAPLLKSLASGYYASIAYELGDFECVAKLLKEHDSTRRHLLGMGDNVLLRQIKAKMYAHKNGCDAAIIELDASLRNSSVKNRECLFRAIQIEKRRLLIISGKLDSLPDTPKATPNVVVYPSEYLECVSVSRARELMARRQFRSAGELLLAEVSIANELGLLWRRMRLWVLISKVFFLEGRRADSASALLNAALDWKSTKGIAAFFDEGDIAIDLIHNAIRMEPRRRATLELLLEDLKAAKKKSIIPLFPKSFSKEQALNAREIEILQLFSDGLPAKLVADKLSISINTVKWHVANIFRKLGAPNKTSAIAIARRGGFVSDTPPHAHH